MLLLVQTAAAPAPVPAPGADVTVITRRLSTWRGSIRRGTCRTRASTGDVAIDRIACSAMEVCVPQFESRAAAAGDRAIRPEVRKVMMTALNADLAKCMDGRHKAGVAALAAERAGA